jgi:predicted nucleic acid-binding protein
MLVILDTNVFLTDLRLQSINFENLFSYLRRTQSKIILPQLVREELIATYKRSLEDAVYRVEAAWKPYSKLILSEDPPDFDPIDIKDEARQLRRRLRNPPKGINIETVLDMKGVSLTDVFLRGIHRIPPANQKGEELRDVILWLFAVQLAKERNETLAFISQDSGFWDSNEKDKPASQILQDVIDNKVQIRLYRSINAFIVENSLESEQVNEEWVLSVVGEKELSDRCGVEHAVEKAFRRSPSNELCGR